VNEEEFEPRPYGYQPFAGPTGAPNLPEDLPKAEKVAAITARYERKLDAWLETWKQAAADSAQDIATQVAQEDAEQTAESALHKAIHDAYVATTQSSLDRALTRMNVVTASVGAIATIYTGLLALVYAAKPGEGEKLSLVGIVPALFLGLSLFLVTVYAAMFRKAHGAMTLLPTGLGGQIAEERLTTFMSWCFGGIWARAWALHAGIVSLGFGLATLPLPFVASPDWLETVIFVGGLLLVLATAAFSSALAKEKGWATAIRDAVDKLPF
jgi:hypothetical protein